jgi:2-methylcitrate dehydratase PrpD
MNTALFEILAKQPIEPAAIKSVRVTLPQMAFDMHGKLPVFKAKFEALISAHYTAAVILHDRALTLAEFEPARYDDPKLRKFAEHQVVARADPSLNIMQTAVEIEMNDGKVHTLRSDHPKGSYENPLTRKEVEDKFRVYAKGVLPASATEEIIAAVSALEQLPSVSALMDMLSPARRRDAA